jgi:hypothetical protein
MPFETSAEPVLLETVEPAVDAGEPLCPEVSPEVLPHPARSVVINADARSKDKNLFLIIFSPFFENNIVVCYKSYENFYENQYRAFCTVIQGICSLFLPLCTICNVDAHSRGDITLLKCNFA